MNVKKQFFWFLMNAVLMCVFTVPVVVVFWLSAFAAGFDWPHWLMLMSNAVSAASESPTKALGTVQAYWGILSFFLLMTYSFIFKFRVSKPKAANPGLQATASRQEEGIPVAQDNKYSSKTLNIE